MDDGKYIYTGKVYRTTPESWRELNAFVEANQGKIRFGPAPRDPTRSSAIKDNRIGIYVYEDFSEGLVEAGTPRLTLEDALKTALVHRTGQ